MLGNKNEKYLFGGLTYDQVGNAFAAYFETVFTAFEHIIS